ncbi:MAG TPA: glycosyl hydrolase, partial [Bacteroidia bacterium]|nr:glycosyl hydrolase [Bacteroidia bacterium]
AVSVHDLIIHPRDNDLVVGTHGRSIYIAHVAELQQLNDTTLAKDLFVFKPSSIKYHANWGKIPETWNDTIEGKIQFAYYVKEKGISIIRIKTIGDNGIVLKTLKDTAKAGLNYISYDLSIDSNMISQYQSWANSSKDLNGDDKKVERADNKKYYLKPGKYIVEVQTERGVISKESFTIKPAEREQEQQEP